MRTFKKNVLKSIFLVALGIFLVVSIAEIGLNLWVRSVLRRELIEAPGRKSQITTHIGWLSMRTLLAGKVNQISVKANNCLLKDLRYAELRIDCQGFWFDVAKMFQEKSLVIIGMEPTQIIGVIDEQALNEYLDMRYPEIDSDLQIKSGGLILSGWASIFSKRVLIELEGDLKAISARQLRFYPTKLIIANQKVSGALLRVAGEQLPIEFGIMEGWPLKISGLTVGENRIQLTMENTESQRGKGRSISN